MPLQTPKPDRPSDLIHLRQLQLPAELWEFVERRAEVTGWAIMPYSKTCCNLPAVIRNLALFLGALMSGGCSVIGWLNEEPVGPGEVIGIKKSVKIWFGEGLQYLPGSSEIADTQASESRRIVPEDLVVVESSVNVEQASVRLSMFGARAYVDGYEVDAAVLLRLPNRMVQGRREVFLELPSQFPTWKVVLVNIPANRTVWWGFRPISDGKVRIGIVRPYESSRSAVLGKRLRAVLRASPVILWLGAVLALIMISVVRRRR